MMRTISLLILALCLSCGKNTIEKDPMNPIQQEQDRINGEFSAFIVPINRKYSSLVNGKAIITKSADTFSVKIEVKDASVGVHKQYLHEGIRCPEMADDLNSDGYIDYTEIESTAGKVLVPLDDDLSSQMAGMSFPVGEDYTYFQETSYSKLLSDLHTQDEVPEDLFIKLSEPDLLLAGRVMIVYATNRGLPASVVGNDIPVACGFFNLSFR